LSLPDYYQIVLKHQVKIEELFQVHHEFHQVIIKKHNVLLIIVLLVLHLEK
jgi:hypothetical protein